MSTSTPAKRSPEHWGPDERLRALRLCPLFRDWPEARLIEVAAIARARSYARGTDIGTHDPRSRDVIVVAAGGVEISSGSAEGKRFVLGLAGAHDVLALVLLLSEVRLPYDLRAYADSVLLHLPCDALTAILDAEPILWRDVALLLCTRHGDSLRLLHDQTLGTLEQRMAATLAHLGRIHGIAAEGGTELGLRLPQEQLGAMLGVTRQSVNRVLRDMERAGVIAIDYNRITIRDAAALDGIAARGA
jgi:CRP-like cAMP-binding protein